MQRTLVLLLSALFLFSAAMVSTSAWLNFSQHKTNVITGKYVPKNEPTLESGSLIITKTVVNADDSALTQAQKDALFEFTVTFSNNDSYVYGIDDGGVQTIKSGGKIKLTHGQVAVIRNIPIGVMYTVTETPVTGYAVSSTGNRNNIVKEGVTAAFTNTYSPAEAETGSLRITKEVSGEGADLDKEFTFTIAFASEGAPQSPQTFTLKHGGEKLFENIPAGVTYTVTEDDYTAEHYTAAVVRYVGTVVTRETVRSFANVYDENPEGKTGALEITKQVSGKGADSDKEFTFTVVFEGDDTYTLPDPIRYMVEGMEHVLSADGKIKLKHNQTAAFGNLPAGVTYTVTEVGAEGYTPSLTAANGRITLGHTGRISFVNDKKPEPEMTALTIKKVIEGEAPVKDKDKIFTFTVYVNGNPLPDKIQLKAGETSKPVPIPVGASYEVREEDYTDDGYIQTAVVNGAGTATSIAIEVIKTNTFTGTVTIEISGEKTWDLSKAPAGTALPESITVYLKNSKTTVDTAVVTPDKDGKWLYAFTASKYDGEEKEIAYTVAESPVPGYVPVPDGYNIKNTWMESLSLAVQKVWQGKDDNNRPQSVQVRLYRNDQPYGDPVPLSAENEWKHTWTQLDGDAIWTVDEPDVPQGYKKTVAGDQNTGVVITNTYEDTPSSETVTVTGKKTWSHGSNPESKQPGQIVIYIKNGNYVIKQKVVTASDNWQWSFTLPKHDEAGKEITYTVNESTVPNYKKTVKVYNITNTFVSPDYPGDIPKTGDSSNLWLWVFLMFSSLTGLVTVTLGIRQRGYRGKYYNRIGR
jgi:hypothetical protein